MDVVICSCTVCVYCFSTRSLQKHTCGYLVITYVYAFIVICTIYTYALRHQRNAVFLKINHSIFGYTVCRILYTNSPVCVLMFAQFRFWPLHNVEAFDIVNQIKHITIFNVYEKNIFEFKKNRYYTRAEWIRMNRACCFTTCTDSNELKHRLASKQKHHNKPSSIEENVEYVEQSDRSLAHTTFMCDGILYAGCFRWPLG